MTGPRAGVAAPSGGADFGVPPKGVDGAGRWLALGLGLLSTGIFLLTTRGVQVADNLVHADTALGIATRGSPALSFDPKDEALAWRRPDGRVVSSLGPGLPMVAAPFVALGAAARRLGGAPREDPLPAALAGAMERAPRRELVARFRAINADPRLVAFSLVNPLLAGATVALVVWLGLVLGLSGRAAGLAGALLGLGSPLLVYAGTGWTQPLVTFALTASAAGLALFGRAPGWRPALAVGAGLGLALLTRLDAAIYGMPLLALFGGVARRARRAGAARLRGPLLAALAPLALALAGWLGWNLLRFGHPVGPAATWQAGRFQPETFGWGAFGLLAGPEDGLLFYAPLALLAPFGAWRLLRAGGARAALAAGALGTLALLVLVYGAWWDWRSNLAYGPRYLVPALPGLALVAAALAEARGRAARILPAAALGLGLAAQIPGTLLGPLKLPEVAAWGELSFGLGWLALLGGHFAVPGSGSLFGDVVDCRSGASPLLAATGLAALGLGALALLRSRRARG